MPVLTDINGNVETDFSFDVDTGTYAHGSCGITFKGHFYIYGSGEDKAKRQIAKVIGCSLKTIDTLPFEHNYGSCATKSNQIILCFDMLSDGKTCYISNEPTGQFSAISKSGYKHILIRSAANERK